MEKTERKFPFAATINRQEVIVWSDWVEHPELDKGEIMIHPRLKEEVDQLGERGTGVILGIEEKHLTRSSDNAPFTLYTFTTHPFGEMSTTKKELMLQARQMLEIPVLLDFTKKQNGNFTNQYLNKIETAPQQTLVAPEPSPTAPQDLAASIYTAGAGMPLQNAPFGRDEAIWRQTASKTACSFHNKDLAEYWERVQMLLDFYRTGVIPDVEASSFIPSENNQMTAEVTDDDIPF